MNSLTTPPEDSLFVTAARVELLSAGLTSQFKAALRYLLDHAIGHANATTAQEICNGVANSWGIQMTPHEFQVTVVRQSRAKGSGYFIGSCFKGFYIINSPEDVKIMREFYEDRIAAEATNLNCLLDQASEAFPASYPRTAV